MAVQVGDKVSYRGVSLEVESVIDGVVNLRRKAGDKMSILISVTEGSNRYYAMFPNEGKVKGRVEFNSELPEVSYAINGRTGCVMGEDDVFQYESETFKQFLEKFSIHTSPIEGVPEAREALAQELQNDPTGLKLFWATCYAYQKSASKFELWNTVDFVDAADKSQRPPKYSSRLLAFYNATLQDDSPATELELANLNKLLPIENTAENVCAICGWDFESYSPEIPDGKLILSRKQVSEVLRDIPSAEDFEELE